MLSLPNDERRALLELARQAVVLAVVERRALAVPTPAGALARPAGAFVTLRRHRRLRGCVGQVEATEPLAAVVARCALAAALEDPRFAPVAPEELVEIEIEISTLSLPATVSPGEVQTGRHGLVVTRGGKRGVLLPQVAAEYRWTQERFLEETCLKAGLEREAWRDQATRIEVFTAEVFSESEFRLERKAEAS